MRRFLDYRIFFEESQMNELVKSHFNEYPVSVRVRMEELRTALLNTASELELGQVEESLKWGEPSYSVKVGSPIRMDWKPKSPDKCYLYFNCQTKLVDTFRELYGGLLEFDGNRAIVLSISEPMPEAAIKHCLELGLTYQKRKTLPLLGA